MSPLTITSAPPAAAYGRATPFLRPPPASSILIDAASILFVAAHLDYLNWFDPLRREHHDVENALASFDCDEAIELRSENNLAILILDRLRKK